MVRKHNSVIETSPIVLAKYGILSPAVKVITDNSSDWLSQFIYETADGTVSTLNSSIMGANPVVTEQIVTPTSTDIFRSYHAFDVQTSLKASLMGNNPAELLLHAKAALDVVLQKNIESEFWNGAIAKQLTDAEGNRYLASTEAVDLTPSSATTGVKPRFAQAILERALGDTTVGSEGVLHMTRDVASTLRLTNSKKVLKTRLGNSVVAGVGYSGTGPDGTAAGENKAWMYATGPVTVRIGAVSVTPEEVGQAVDITINNVTYYVDRPAAVTWSTSELFAVLVDLSQDLA